MQKYEIKGIVGEGAYGIVYQAKVKETGEIGKHFSYCLFIWVHKVKALALQSSMSHCSVRASSFVYSG